MILILTWYFVDNNYHMMSPGQNCPIHEVILTENDCRTASNKLGPVYQYSFTSASYPAGCNYNDIYNETYFNSIISPSSTHPEKFRSSYVGLCTKTGIELFTIDYYINY